MFLRDFLPIVRGHLPPLLSIPSFPFDLSTRRARWPTRPPSFLSHRHGSAATLGAPALCPRMSPRSRVRRRFQPLRSLLVAQQSEWLYRRTGLASLPSASRPHEGWRHHRAFAGAQWCAYILPFCSIRADRRLYSPDFTQRWITNDNWTYTADVSSFVRSNAFKNAQKTLLVFYGIDTIANIVRSHACTSQH